MEKRSLLMLSIFCLPAASQFLDQHGFHPSHSFYDCTLLPSTHSRVINRPRKPRGRTCQTHPHTCMLFWVGKVLQPSYSCYLPAVHSTRGWLGLQLTYSRREPPCTAKSHSAKIRLPGMLKHPSRMAMPQISSSLCGTCIPPFIPS